jgi:hypothetical protein
MVELFAIVYLIGFSWFLSHGLIYFFVRKMIPGHLDLLAAIAASITIAILWPLVAVFADVDWMAK